MSIDESLNEFSKTQYSKSQMRRMNIQRQEKLNNISQVVDTFPKSMHDVILNTILEFTHNGNSIKYDAEELAYKIEENLIDKGY